MVKENFNGLENPFKLLGTALFAYMVIIVSIITLAPFQYQIPANIAIHWDRFDIEVIQNIILFFPLGFFLVASMENRFNRSAIRALILGTTFSAIIELNQLFMPERFASVTDVLANGFGAYLGGLAALKISRKLTTKLPGIRVLEIPVTQLLFLLIPLLWLASMGVKANMDRILFLFVLGLATVMLLTDIYIYRVKQHYQLSNSWLLFITFIWLTVAMFPALVNLPMRTLVIIFTLILFTALLLFYKRRKPTSKRFEFIALNRFTPFYIIYLTLLSQWPLALPRSDFTFSFATNQMYQNSELIYIISNVEYFAAFTIVGFVLYQYLNRGKQNTVPIFRLILYIGLAALLLELPKGFHPLHNFTVSRVFYGTFWGIFGALIYILQLHWYKVISLRKREPELHLDFETKSVVAASKTAINGTQRQIIS